MLAVVVMAHLAGSVDVPVPVTGGAGFLLDPGEITFVALRLRLLGDMVLRVAHASVYFVASGAARGRVEQLEVRRMAVFHERARRRAAVAPSRRHLLRRGPAQRRGVTFPAHPRPGFAVKELVEGLR